MRWNDGFCGTRKIERKRARQTIKGGRRGLGLRRQIVVNQQQFVQDMV